MEYLRAWLRAEMDRRSWTKRDVATASGGAVSATTVQSLLDGTTKTPTLGILDGLGEVFGVPLWRMIELAGFSVDLTAPGAVADRMARLMEADPMYQRIAAELARLHPDDAAAVVAYLEGARLRRQQESDQSAPTRRDGLPDRS